MGCGAVAWSSDQPQPRRGDRYDDVVVPLEREATTCTLADESGWEHRAKTPKGESGSAEDPLPGVEPTATDTCNDSSADLVDWLEQLQLGSLFKWMELNKSGTTGSSIWSSTPRSKERRRKRSRKQVDVLCIMSSMDGEGESKETFAEKSLTIQILGGEAKVGVDHVNKQVPDCMGFSCKKGLKEKSPNQDSFLILHAPGRFNVFGVFDGHGRQGHKVSDFAKDLLVKVLLLQGNLESDTRSALIQAFTVTQDHLAQADQRSRIDASLSGCTATVVFHDLQSDTLHVAHVGDSRCVLGSKLSSGLWQARSLTQDHKPELQSERKRIETAGGRVLSDGGKSHRVYVQGKRYPGLNMSRSIGDLWGNLEAGLSARPDVRKIKMSHGLDEFVPATLSSKSSMAKHGSLSHSAMSTEVSVPGSASISGTTDAKSTADISEGGVEMGPEEFKAPAPTAAPSMLEAASSGEAPIAKVLSASSCRSCATSVSSLSIRHAVNLLILGSDGVWDQISSQEAVEIAAGYPPSKAMEAARQISREALKRWIRCFHGKAVDDITVIVVYLS